MQTTRPIIKYQPPETSQKSVKLKDYPPPAEVSHPKEKKPKLIPMLPEDIELYKSFPIGLPDLYFFRHNRAMGTAKPGDKFSKDCLPRYWRKACMNLGIKGVDMYGGTRHSKTTALSQLFTKEELREHGTRHSTNKAFERYMQVESSSSLKIYEASSKIGEGKDKKKILDFSKTKISDE